MKLSDKNPHPNSSLRRCPSGYRGKVTFKKNNICSYYLLHPGKGPGIRVSILIFFFFFTTANAYARTPLHHLYLFGRRTAQAVIAPVYGVAVEGPRRVKEAYTYEVWEHEKPEKNGRLSDRAYAVWRAPGEEIKGTLSGIKNSVGYATEAIEHLVSIFFSD